MNNNPKDNKLKIVIMDLDKEKKKVRFDSLKIGEIFYTCETNKPKRNVYVKTSKTAGICIKGQYRNLMSGFSQNYMVMYKKRIIGIDTLDTIERPSNFYKENGISMESINVGDIFVAKSVGVCVCFQGMCGKEVVSLTLGWLVDIEIIDLPVLLWREEDGHF